MAYARMKYELENANKPGMMSNFWGIFRKSPDVRAAAKSGQPAMTSLRPDDSGQRSAAAAAAAAGVSGADVTVSDGGGDTTALDTQPDARQNPPKPDGAKAAATSTEPSAGRTGQSTPKQKKQIEEAVQERSVRNEPDSPGRRQPARPADGRANSARGRLRGGHRHRRRNRPRAAGRRRSGPRRWPTSCCPASPATRFASSSRASRGTATCACC